MTNYARGRRIEYRVMRDLEDSGYTVYRTAGSHGHFDLIAYKPGDVVRFYQIKYSRKPSATKDELDAFNAAPLPKPSKAFLYHYQRGHLIPVVHSRKG